MKEIYNQISVQQALAPVVVDADTLSSAIDMSGANALSVNVSFGAPGDTLSETVYFTVSLVDSDNGTDYTAVDSAYVLGTLGVFDGAAAAQMNAAYLGGKRYVKVSIAKTGTHTNGTPIAVTAIKGERRFV